MKIVFNSDKLERGLRASAVTLAYHGMLCLMWITLASSVGCTKKSGPSSVAETGNVAGRRALLNRFANEVLLPLYAEQTQSAEKLLNATQAYAVMQDDGRRLSAQSAWRDLNNLWQRAELYQVGPAGMKNTVKGGQDMRDDIYTWPLINRCRIDQVTKDKSYESSGFLASQPSNIRGLYALEYLLFISSTANACPAGHALNAAGQWDALSAEAVYKQRAEYARAVASQLQAQIQKLHYAWQPSGDNFVDAFANAGINTSVYPNTQAALNGLTDGLFYIETDTKSMKIGAPSGMVNCESDTCPEAVETPNARQSKENIVFNIDAFEAVAKDPKGVASLELLLRDSGAPQVADDLVNHLHSVRAKVEAIPGLLEDALAADLQSVRSAYEEFKKLSAFLKTDFVSALDLELPARAEADND